MQFIINGTTYEAASIERITGRHALDLPRQAGLGVQTLAHRLEELPRLGYSDDGSIAVLPAGATKGHDANAVMDSEPHLRALLAFIWLSRRLSGEASLTFDEACDFPLMTLEIVADEDDATEEESVDPTSPPASDPREPGADAA